MLKKFQGEVLKVNIAVREVELIFLFGKLIEFIINFILILRPYILSFPKQIINFLMKTHRFFYALNILLLRYLDQKVENIFEVVIQVGGEYIQVH